MKHTPAGAADSSKPALVVAAHGRRGILAQPDGRRLPFMIRGRHLRAYCGDRVSFQVTTVGEPVLITRIEPRENELQRLSGRGGLPETIAANVTHLVVVMAALPAPDLYLTDRYLCAARLMGATSTIAWNKSDMAALPAAELSGYDSLGCPVWSVSAVTGAGIAALRGWIGTGTAILVGQSGVGKSSLLNALVPGIDATTGEISLSSDEGRHTTTASVLHPLPGGGCLLDTPGVRDFVPAIPERTAISQGFAEIDEYGRQCRFTDCSHLRESHCAVQEAVTDGLIDRRRYESYRRLMNLVRQADGRAG
ncbi:MAG: ribosome small subunit-dependent GTPase A [Gammaproteobacteria bacterium]|nr:ribosome small subunit-dependent GTPase A [Gammaproteobacteria bacterium]